MTMSVHYSAALAMTQHRTKNEAEPMLSFGVPVRNGARFLRRLLESLRAQDFPDFEVVVCDNQSTDDTGSIVKEFAEHDPRFKYHLNEANIGQIENFNRVVERSTGRYFRWIGSDDWLEPSYARHCVAALEANPEAVGVTTLWRYVDDEGNEELLNSSGLRVESENALRRLSRMLWLLQADGGADPIYSALRSSLLKQTSLLPIGPWTDRALALELAIAGPFCHVQECLATRRNAREPAKVRLARYHSNIKEVERATEVRLAPRWTMYRDLSKVVLDSSLGSTDRVLGTGVVVAFGALYHARAVARRVARLVERPDNAAMTA